MPSSSEFIPWLKQRGFAPSLMNIDPLKGVYDNLIQSLQNDGYVLNQSLFEAVYDSRMPPGPLNGNFTNITSDQITSGVYLYGVDYLGYWLNQAVQAWQLNYPGLTMPPVDVICHSTGGLVVRLYIQSAHMEVRMSMLKAKHSTCQKSTT